MFAMHGTQKYLGWPPSEGGGGGGLPPLMMVAGVIELVGGLMILFGIFASVAAFIASGEMAVAYFMVHIPQHWNPLNHGENAALYAFAFLYVATRGSGIWSLDALRTRPRAE